MSTACHKLEVVCYIACLAERSPGACMVGVACLRVPYLTQVLLHAQWVLKVGVTLPKTMLAFAGSYRSNTPYSPTHSSQSVASLTSGFHDQRTSNGGSAPSTPQSGYDLQPCYASASTPCWTHQQCNTELLRLWLPRHNMTHSHLGMHHLHVLMQAGKTSVCTKTCSHFSSSTLLHTSS